MLYQVLGSPPPLWGQGVGKQGDKAYVILGFRVSTISVGTRGEWSEMGVRGGRWEQGMLY